MQSRLITNPGASGVTESIVSQVASRLTPVTDLEISYTTRQGHATELAAEVSSGLVIALGGDGTFNEVVNGLRPGVAFAALPGGASSVYARQLGYPDDPIAAAPILARAIAADSRRSVGLGLVDGRRFTFAASVGFDADCHSRSRRGQEESTRQRSPGGSARVVRGAAGAGRTGLSACGADDGERRAQTLRCAPPTSPSQINTPTPTSASCR